MAAKKKEEGAAAGAAPLVLFRFSKLWSSDRGLFAPGDEAELPGEIALSLEGEGMGEIL